MKRIYIKEKRFLKNFTILLLLLLAIVIIVVYSVYQMSRKALEQEVKNMNQNTVFEMKNRVEEVLEQCNQMVSRLVIDERIQLYYTHANPDYLVENYYSEIGSKLNSHGIEYIDSIMLYAPKFERIFGEDFSGKSVSISEEAVSKMAIDISWLDEIETGQRRLTKIFTRAKSDRWPYYITILKQWRQGKTDGVIVINIDLIKLHEHLIAGRNESMQLFLVDHNQQIILKESKGELYTPITEAEYLDVFQPGESFSVVQVGKEEGYAYAQAYSDAYDLTCVTITPISDYLVEITLVQRKFVLVAVLAVIVAAVLACIYSIKLVKPLQDLQQLLNNPIGREKEQIQYDENIREIADQIISNLQMNTQLREELDSRLDLLKDTQMLALQAQINPHFLFNTLNAISLTVESDCGNEHPGVQMLSVLSSILRYSLSDSENVSILEELEYVKKYLAIMKYRYEDFEIVIDADEALYDCAIPKLILQPLVENALQHGMSACMSVRKGILTIQVHKESYTYSDGNTLDSVCIDITDNGIGMDENNLLELRKCIADHSDISRKHIGLSNVAQRFYLLFHSQQEMILDSTLGRGTHVRILFPMMPLNGSKL